jgi:hypothetical protein
MPSVIEDRRNALFVEGGVDGVDDDEHVWATYKQFQVVGNGVKTRDSCGTFKSVYDACLRVDLHNKMIFGKDSSVESVKGKVFVHHNLIGCGKPACPVCYKKSWAIHEAKLAEFRLVECAKDQGVHTSAIEHIMASVPESDYLLVENNYERARVKVLGVFYRRGVIGGILIFHGFSYHNADEAAALGESVGWFWHPHWHVVGFIQGGYRCRICKYLGVSAKGNSFCSSSDKGCNGFEVRTRRENSDGVGFGGKWHKADGYIVKVMEERAKVWEKYRKDCLCDENVRGTLHYQLNHSTIRTDVKRSHSATWFGVCSYKKFKISDDARKAFDKRSQVKVCPWCEHDLVKARYCGCDDLVFDKAGNCSSDFVQYGCEVWVEVDNDHG